MLHARYIRTRLRGYWGYANTQENRELIWSQCKRIVEMFARLCALVFDRTFRAINRTKTSPLLSLPTIWIREWNSRGKGDTDRMLEIFDLESILQTMYHRIDPSFHLRFSLLIYSLFPEITDNFIINGISSKSEQVRGANFRKFSFDRSALIARARVSPTQEPRDPSGKNVAYLAGHVSFYPCSRLNSWDLKIRRVPTFHLKVTSSSISILSQGARSSSSSVL